MLPSPPDLYDEDSEVKSGSDEDQKFASKRTAITWGGTYRRVEALRKNLLSILTREVRSTFLEDAMNTWQALGPQKAQSVCYEMGSFGVEKPGYYGVQEYEVIYLTLSLMFMSPAALNETTRLAHPLSLDYFIRKVLVLETALSLIAEDLNTVSTDPLVYKTLEDSRVYGVAKFPDTASLI
ncbi:uncharacterized protein VP01_1099g8 [Puccinia sorghi]|uniref:Restriction of telomere capping protein 4 n=1 Tax=Puccinia sorghi TaxID=27349 RepID=A0A0L6VSY3_9BASI|nr:uncharacterized protein VP01_1099g8 [Puccinia sorghi]